MDKGALIGIAVLITIIIAGAYLISNNQAMLSSNSSPAIISLTDPPHVPAGTSSLTVMYSAVQAHVVNASGSSWVNVQGSGSVDLLTLVNVSQVIGSSRIAANSTINAVRFNVTSASITINGTTYNVSTPNNRISANVSNGANGSIQVLMDLSPSIVEIYTNSSTIFVLVPSVKAVAFIGGNGQFQFGSRSQLSASEKAAIESNSANISITGEQAMTAGNQTTFSVTVKNNGNQSVILRHVSVNGKMQIYIKPFASVDASGQAGLHENSGVRPAFLRIGSALNSSINSSIRNLTVNISEEVLNATGKLLNSSVHIAAEHEIKIDGYVINGSMISSGNVSINGHAYGIGNVVSISDGEIEVGGRSTGISISGIGAKLNSTISAGAALGVSGGISNLTSVGLQLNSLRTISFLIASNGTLLLPSSISDMHSEAGYALAPGASATFSFTGSMAVGHGHILLDFVPGSGYGLYVQGEQGENEAHARANVTAS